MRVFQVLPTITMGDGVSQNALDIEKILRKNGYRCDTYSQSIIGKMLKKKVKSFDEIPEIQNEDIILYHLSTGSDIVDTLVGMKGKLVVCYHNITPAHFFSKYDKLMELACERGRCDMHKLVERADYCIADSAYNVNELKEAGYKCECTVVPIGMDFSRFEGVNVLDCVEDKKKHILFTGRIVPNKKIEDLIDVFAELQKTAPGKYALDIVGKYDANSSYYKRLRKYENILGITDVAFHGHVSNEELVKLYRNADVYLSLSEHEGFCIPLLEAMYFNIPVVAYDAGAVKETMCGAGVVLQNKGDAVKWIQRMLDGSMAQNVSKDYCAVLDKYAISFVENIIIGVMREVIGEKNEVI